MNEKVVCYKMTESGRKPGETSAGMGQNVCEEVRESGEHQRGRNGEALDKDLRKQEKDSSTVTRILNSSSRANLFGVAGFELAWVGEERKVHGDRDHGLGPGTGKREGEVRGHEREQMRLCRRVYGMLNVRSDTAIQMDGTEHQWSGQERRQTQGRWGVLGVRGSGKAI